MVKLVACGALLASCGGTPKPPTQEMSQAKAVVRAADEVGAREAPQAALHFKMANDQIDTAELLIDKEQMKKARYLLLQAEADAELSLALAKAALKKQQAEEAALKVEKLEKELK